MGKALLPLGKLNTKRLNLLYSVKVVGLQPHFTVRVILGSPVINQVSRQPDESLSRRMHNAGL